MKKSIQQLIIVVIGLVLINFLAANKFARFDFTIDQRYSISEASKSLLSEVNQPLKIKVYLAGDLPSTFKQLQLETRYLLEEYKAQNPNISFQFVNPVEDGEDATEIAKKFYEQGMTPERVNIAENGKVTERIVFPWAEASYQGEKFPLSLLKKKIGAETEEMLTASIQHLEYAFSDGLRKLVKERSKKIAVLKGKGQLEDKYIADFFRSLRDYYLIAPFTLRSIENEPNKTLEQLNEFDLIIDAKPEKKYSEKEKYALDQYLMQGGNALWLVEQVTAEQDSLKKSGSTLAFPKELDLYDFFFNYGVRINPQLVNDLYSAPIILAQGSGSQAQFNPFPWMYKPLAAPAGNHPITSAIERVQFDFANPIDLLKTDINQTVLLHSSELTKLEGVPREISLNLIEKEPNFSTYTKPNQALAVLLEGEFKSLYKNRVLPFENPNHLDKSLPTQQVVISDGDVVKNKLRRNQPEELGFQPFTGETYGNKTFLMNTVNFLLDDDALLALRNKPVILTPISDEVLAKSNYFWALFNLIAPLAFLFVFGGLLIRRRKKKFAY